MTLENLVKINQLKSEPFDKNEIEGLLKAAVDRLNDSQYEVLSFASRFDLAYSAAHGLALAALRASGPPMFRMFSSRCALVVKATGR